MPVETGVNVECSQLFSVSPLTLELTGCQYTPWTLISSPLGDGVISMLHSVFNVGARDPLGRHSDDFL